MAQNEHLSDLLIQEVKRRLIIEGYSRIETCLNLLDDKTLWHRTNKETVSAGNLILHLIGNVNQ